MELEKKCEFCGKLITYEEWSKSVFQPSMSAWNYIKFCGYNCSGKSTKRRNKIKKDEMRYG